jgi:hypothetical protein
MNTKHSTLDKTINIEPVCVLQLLIMKDTMLPFSDYNMQMFSFL